MSRVVFLLACASAAAQTGWFAIADLAIEGNHDLDRAAILTATGLHKGDAANPASFDAARDRLLATGYFDTVAYRFRMAPSRASDPGGFAVTFEVHETATLYPIRAESLPASTAQVLDALRRADPLFKAGYPATRPALDRLAKLVESLAPGNPSPAARVTQTGSGGLEILLTPARGLPIVASLTFKGSKAIPPADLRSAVDQQAFGTPFSEAGFRAFLDDHVRPLYEAKGYMHVRYPEIAASRSTRVEGVDVTVTVDEGEPYQLSRISVRGVEDQARMLRMAKIPPMTTANFDQIREGAARLKDALRHDGYLDAEVSFDRKPDDTNHTVEAILSVSRGAAYTFGRLTVNGLGLDGEAAIRKLWSVKTGDPFPADYATYFASQVKQEGLFDRLAEVKATPYIQHDTHIVDVTLDFKAAAPRGK